MALTIAAIVPGSHGWVRRHIAIKMAALL